jgi:hypothetical protein
MIRVHYPKLQDIIDADRGMLCYWHRFLPSPGDAYQKELMDLLRERYEEAGGYNYKLSRQIGWATNDYPKFLENYMNKIAQAVAVADTLKGNELIMFYQTLYQESIANMRNDYTCNTDMREDFIVELKNTDLSWLEDTNDPPYDILQDLIDWPSRSVEYREKQVAEWLAVQAKQDAGDFELNWENTDEV